MTDKNFRQILEALLSKSPFQVFTIELRSGERYAVTQPRALAYRDGLVVLLADHQVSVYFDHESVSSIILARAGRG